MALAKNLGLVSQITYAASPHVLQDNSRQSKIPQSNALTQIKQSSLDQQIRREKRTKTSKTAKRCKIIYKILAPFRIIAMISLFVTPFVSIPSWCIERNLAKEDCLPKVYPTSGIPKLSRDFILFWNTFNIVILFLSTFIRMFIKKMTKTASCRSIYLILMMLICLIDLAFTFTGLFD